MFPLPSGISGRPCPFCGRGIIPGQRGKPRQTCGAVDCQRKYNAQKQKEYRERKKAREALRAPSEPPPGAAQPFTLEDFRQAASEMSDDPEEDPGIETEWGTFPDVYDAFLEAPRQFWREANALLEPEAYVPELIDTAGRTTRDVLAQAFGWDVPEEPCPDTVTTEFPSGTWFDPVRALRVVLFVERFCTHTKDRFARQPFIMPMWQKVLVALIFGTVRWDAQWLAYVRSFLLAWIEVARKNGKSELMAALGLYLLMADAVESAEVYGAAKDRDQARAVYNVARRMCEVAPLLKRFAAEGKLAVVDSKKTIKWLPLNAEYIVVAADAAGNLGSNPSGVLFDEILTQPNRELWDAFTTGTGTREGFLMLAATTAGNDSTSFCYAEHEFSINVATTPDADPTRFVYIRVVPEGMGEEWRDESLWHFGNPALGDFLNIADLRALYTRAVNQGDLTQLSAFRQFRCNQWQRQANRWIDMSVWDENTTVVGQFEEDDCVGILGYAGLDLSETEDFTAWVMVFETEDRLMIIPRFWIPRASIEKKHKRIKSWLTLWEQDGFLTVTDGEVISYAAIWQQILADLEKFEIAENGYDQWNATNIVQLIETTTETVCVKIPQTTLRLNAASKELMRLLGMRALAHNDNPILRWMADNVEAQRDPEGNLKPSKNKSVEKIDGIAALVNALAVMIRERDEDPTPEFYYPED